MIKKVVILLLSQLLLLSLCSGCAPEYDDTLSDPTSTASAVASTAEVSSGESDTASADGDGHAASDASLPGEDLSSAAGSTGFEPPHPDTAATSSAPDPTGTPAFNPATVSIVTSSPSSSAAEVSRPAVEQHTTRALLNGVPVSKYTIVYDDKATDYAVRAANYIRDRIRERVGAELKITSDAVKAADHEIVVGETDRPVSRALTAPGGGVEFAVLAKDGSVAIEGDCFVIAAAAYYFVETYITGAEFSSAAPTSARVCEPIAKDPKYYIFLIGDGMGVYQTRFFETMKASEWTDCSDNESVFYGYLLPYAGKARTNSLSGLTDSAAAGTVLATGHKTYNRYIGRDKDKNDLQSLTEIAGLLGMSTAVMTTDVVTGATPAAFSAHANDRDDRSDIAASQEATTRKYGTVIKAELSGFSNNSVNKIEDLIRSNLTEMAKNGNGFFFMYEEAYIDLYGHNMDKENVFRSMVRFNQVIGAFMEFAFYNPETFLLITADHETGRVKEENGDFVYTYNSHSDQDVPVFAYGRGGELFDKKTVENVQIPKTISAFWGREIVDPDTAEYPALK